jgi:hypothetical protein
MRKSKYSEVQIIGFLRQAEAGTPVAEIRRKGGFSDATFYKWRSKSDRTAASAHTCSVLGLPKRNLGRLSEMWTPFCRPRSLGAATMMSSASRTRAESCRQRPCRR